MRNAHPWEKPLPFYHDIVCIHAMAFPSFKVSVNCVQHICHCKRNNCCNTFGIGHQLCFGHHTQQRHLDADLHAKNVLQEPRMVS